MIVEIAGLPGAGKSTLINQIAIATRTRGGTATSLRRKALQNARAARDRLRFLRNKPERTSLFGAYRFRENHPEVFAILEEGGPEQLPAILWNLETMSQYFFATEGDPEPDLILVDEGFVHRGVAHLIDRETEVFERYNAALPADFSLLHLDVPVTVAMARAEERYHGLGRLWPGLEDDEIGHQLQRRSELLKRACQLRAARGLPVVTIDGSRPLPQVKAAAILALEAALSCTLGGAV